MNPSSLTIAEQFEPFASLYDSFTAASDYEAFTRGIEALIGPPGTLLDVACGTGNSFLPFLRRGFAVTGCDLSPAMLAVARRKAPEVPLVEADMRELPKLGAFDLVTCIDEPLNYLLSDADVTSAFESMARNLAPGGRLAFDMNSLATYRTTFAERAEHETRGKRFRWTGSASPDVEPGCTAEAVIEVQRVGGAPMERLVVQRQRHHPAERVPALLAAAGLECRGTWGLRADGSIDPDFDELVHLKFVCLAEHEKRRR
jgi:SAM-dependent methyltransferase